jgi:hypothetical protein
MRTRFLIPLLLLLVAFALSGSNCLLDEKVLEIVYFDKTCADFEENEASEVFTTSVTVDYAEDLDDILDDNGISKSDINSAHVVSATYMVTDFSHTHDWDISGVITVRRFDTGGAAVTLVTYTSQSVLGALNTSIPAVLNAAGVELINQALEEYITDTADPVLEFSVENGDVSPNPSAQDMLVFDWTGCVGIHIVAGIPLEVPDPF